jgi:hypothetical protein
MGAKMKMTFAAGVIILIFSFSSAYGDLYCGTDGTVSIKQSGATHNNVDNVARVFTWQSKAARTFELEVTQKNGNKIIYILGGDYMIEFLRLNRSAEEECK